MALFLTKDLDDPAHSRIGVWHITESEEELRGMTSIKSESLRRQKLAVRALLDNMFEEKVYLSHHDNGKPYIENNVTNISITHTDKYVAIMLNDNDDVGIDVESLDRDFSAVEKKALSDDEREDLEDDEERKDERNKQLALYWCAKEAVLKKTGQYDLDLSEQIEIDHFHPKSDGELDAVFIDDDGEEEEISLAYMTFDRHVLVWTIPD